MLSALKHADRPLTGVRIDGPSWPCWPCSMLSDDGLLILGDRQKCLVLQLIHSKELDDLQIKASSNGSHKTLLSRYLHRTNSFENQAAPRSIIVWCRLHGRVLAPIHYANTRQIKSWRIPRRGALGLGARALRLRRIYVTDKAGAPPARAVRQPIRRVRGRARLEFSLMELRGAVVGAAIKRSRLDGEPGNYSN
ncbi:hypothetical protein EVAR_67705_1 [Eumeta japonica]|uniref:Uncharacterized protein n=1 Tax=Eumeta variegata TaxID=151549 RepID=A0A4C2A7U1_EUMVA|nr:hypothetical protein EVAR_67705_1 [Eumeta japonica]